MKDIQFVIPDKLTPLKVYNEQAVNNLMLSIKIANSVRPVPVDSVNKVILGGFNRFEAIRRLGFKKVPVWIVDADKLSIIDSNNKQLKISTLIESINKFNFDFQILYNNKPLSLSVPRVFIPTVDLTIKVFCVGVFDLFHIGHVNLLKRARLLGDHLTVGVQYNVEKFKTEPVYYSFDERIFLIQALRFVDVAIPYENVFDAVQSVTFDIFVVGPDQNHEMFEKSFDYCKSNNIRIETLSRTKGVSSSMLRKLMSIDDAAEFSMID